MKSRKASLKNVAICVVDDAGNIIGRHLTDSKGKLLNRFPPNKRRNLNDEMGKLNLSCLVNPNILNLINQNGDFQSSHSSSNQDLSETLDEDHQVSNFQSTGISNDNYATSNLTNTENQKDDSEILSNSGADPMFDDYNSLDDQYHDFGNDNSFFDSPLPDNCIF